MKHAFDPRPCGGARPPLGPKPDRPGRWNDPPEGMQGDGDCERILPGLPRCPGGYLMQRILACGGIHRRRQCYPLCLNELPDQARPPITVADAAVCAAPQWEEACCRDRRGLDFLVTVPLLLRVRDGAGCICTVQSFLQERLRLCPRAPERECWRGQVYVQAAVRLCGCAPCRENPCQVPLEVLIEGYILAPCALGAAPFCPPQKPWYPQPRYDPWNEG